MLRHDIMARYILSSHHFQPVRQVTIRLELARSGRAPTFHPRLACHPTVAPWKRSSDGCASHPPPLMGGGAGFHARAQPSGNSRHPSHHRRELPEDRKSTRLNSSHDQISYAVFCLKKKKQV